MTLKKLGLFLLLTIGFPGMALAQIFTFNEILRENEKTVYQADVQVDLFIQNLEKGYIFELAFDDITYHQKVSRIDNVTGGYKSIITNAHNSPKSNSNLLLKNGKITGTIRFENTPYRLAVHDDEYHLFEITVEVHQCLIHESGTNKSLKKGAGGPYANPEYNLPNYSDTTTVDVLILYTTDAKNWAANSDLTTDINSLIAQNEGFKNEIIDNSKLPLKIRFVGSEEVANNSYSSDDEILENLRDNTYNSGSVDIHAMRDSYGADLVSFFEEYDGGGGVGYRPNAVGGSPESGFSVARVQQLSFTYTQMHEIGHNFGNAHGRTQEVAETGDNGGIFQFSTGHWLDTGSDDYVTVMHYEDLGSDQASTIPYFSNPRVNYDGQPTGQYTGTGGPSDNVLSMSITKNWIADYRDPEIDPPAISVSTSTVNKTINPSGVGTKSVTIENTGDSDLEVKLDGEMEFSSSLKTNEIEQPLNLSYDFEQSENFQLGTYSGYNNWRSNDSSEPFEISTSRAASGSQSLKISPSSISSGNIYVHSPYFSTTSRYSSYTISMKVYSEGGPTDVYLELSSADTTNKTAGLKLDSGGETYFYGYLGSPQSQKAYWSYSDSQITGGWVDVSIMISPENGGTITYNYGPSISRTFTNNGYYFPEDFQVVLTSSSANDLYIDDIQISAQDLYGPALTIDDSRITIPAGSTATADVNFYGNENSAGSYDGNIYLETNDPNNDSLAIPVNLTIDPDASLAEGEFAVELTGQEGFRMLSAPVDMSLKDFLEPLHTQGATGGDFTGGSPNVWLWDNTFSGSTNNGWTAVTDLNTTVNAGEAVLVYVYKDSNLNDESVDGFPKLLSINGDAAASTNPTVNSNGDGFTHVGNPYPSSIDWDQIQKSDLKSTIYVYDPNGSGWITYNGSTGDITDGILKPFQGFFVQTVSSPGSPSLTFSTDDIVSGGSFYGKEKNKIYMRLALKDSSNSLRNSAYVSFQSGSSFDQDGHDALELTPLSNEYLTLSTQSDDGTDLDINAVPVHKSSFSVPLNIQSTSANRVYLSATDLEGLEDFEVFLVENGKRTKLTAGTELELNVSTVPDEEQNQKKSLLRKKKPSSATTNSYKLLFAYYGDDGLASSIPSQVKILPNYPNPFNPSTNIRFGLPEQSDVRITVFNMLGQRVRTLINESKEPGFHTVRFDGGNLASGIYLYRIEALNYVKTSKMLLVK